MRTWWGGVLGAFVATAAGAAPFAWLGHGDAGNGTEEAASDCLADLDPSVPTAKIVLARCATTTPATLGNPCDPGASDMAAVADCVLDAQLAQVSEAVAAEYGRPCSIATAVGLAAIHPGLCPTP